jgi:adenosylcobinamide-GDP ribazoletransferase
MTGLRAAISFLTRLRIRPSRTGDPAIGASIPWFPAVGAAIGLSVGGVYAGLRALEAPAIVASTVAVLGGVVLTGGLHEDGLADTADAMGGVGPEHAFTIMADPAHGTYGVLSLVGSVLLRVGALASMPSGTGVFVAVSANAVGRGAAVGVMAAFRSARPTGLGATYCDRIRRSVAIAGITPALVLTIGRLGWSGLASIVVAAGIAAAIGLATHRRYGGVTGDVLGAVEQLTEMSTYLILATITVRSMELV